MYKFLSSGLVKQVNFISISSKRLNYKVNVQKFNSEEENIELMDFANIPGPKSYPVVGTLYKYLPLIGDYNAESLDKNAWLNYQRYGLLAREVLFQGTGLLHVFDPVDIESVFRQDDKVPHRRSHVAMLHYRLSKPHTYNSGGLLSTNGPEWYRLRSTFQKNFTHPQCVKEHIETTDSVVRDFLEWIKQKKLNVNDDFLPYLNRLNLEVIGRIAFDEKFNSFSPTEQDSTSRSSKVIAAAFGSNSGIMKLDKGFLWRLIRTPLYAQLAKSQEYLEKVATDIMVEKLNFYEDKCENIQDSANCLLSFFVKQPNVDTKDIIGMMVDILMAAIDTTAYSTSFALYHVARNPDCQEKLYHEVVELLPNKDSVLTLDALSKAQYVRCCVKESLRLNPVAIGVGRLLQKDIAIRGYLIPKGTVVVTQNMIASRLPQFVKDPARFIPERWMRGSPHYDSIHPFTSLPFGFGPRACIARRLAEQNIYITLIRIIRQFKIEFAREELGIQTHLINKPDKPVRFNFVTRER